MTVQSQTNHNLTVRDMLRRIDELERAISRAYGDLWRDAREHSELVARARTRLLSTMTAGEQKMAINAAIERHGPIEDSEILRA